MNASDIPGNRFAMVNVTIKRARQLTAGAMPRVPARAGENVVGIVVRELRRGAISVPDTDAPKA